MSQEADRKLRFGDAGSTRALALDSQIWGINKQDNFLVRDVFNGAKLDEHTPFCGSLIM
jgi:hypothetical protein